ncbi:MAG: hypothetical protein J5669_02335 [Bacteroidales bacterium]|nr:hypothetical protein [Bacteroidales bacterium]
MRCLISCFGLLLALVSCQIPLFDDRPRWKQNLRQDASVQVLDAADTVILDKPLEPGVYVTALCFPDWANWREGDYRGAQAVLFRDSVKVLSVPAGDRPDADRLRLWGGHLWTQQVQGGETLLLCDGEERIRYPGDERLRGFLVADGAVHTLEQHAGGEGCCYRINGVEVFSSAQGVVMGSLGDREWEGGALMRDSTGVYYVYGIPFRQGEAQSWEYRVMRGAQTVKLIPAHAPEGWIYDIRVLDGTVWRCERRDSSSQSLCLVKEDLYMKLDIGAGEQVRSAKLIPLQDGEMGIKGVSRMSADGMVWVRTQNGLQCSVPRPDIQAFYYSGGALSFVASLSNGLVSSLFSNQVSIPVEAGVYSLLGERCAHFRDGVFAAALTNAGSEEHLLLVNQERIPFTFNGFFTSLWIE